MRLILVRHGETEHNAGGLVQGRADIPLNELGRRQAEALAAALGGENVHSVVSSPLRRASDTASIIAASQHLSVTIEPDLVEMNVGEMEGLSGAQMRERFPEFMAIWAGAQGPATPMPGGESLQQVQARGWSVVERLHAAYPDETVVAVSHNFVIAGIVCRAIGVPLDAFRRFRHGVASRTVVDLRPNRSLVLHLNDTCHLDTSGLRSAGPWEGPLSRSARGEQPA